MEKTQTVLLAVSGGADSVCLARLMHRAGFKAAIAHVNYGLRGKESDEDARFVAELARELGFPFHLLNTCVSEDDKRQQGLQAAARKLRYDWFGQLCRNLGYQSIATAHQADDVYETYLLYHRQGRHTAALNAMPLMRPLDDSDPTAPLLLRPLRFARRAEIREWLQTEGYPWREDSSNTKPDYARNRLRMELEQSALQADLLTSIHTEQLAYQQQTRNWERLTRVFIGEAYGETVIRSEAIYQSPEGQAWLSWFLRPLGFNAAQCAQLWKDGRNAGKSHHSQTAWRIETARGSWYLVNAAQQAWPPQLLQPDAQTQVLPFFSLKLEIGPPGAYPYSGDKMAFQLEEKNPVLELRPYQTGETMYIARAGHRKISDILSEAGIPRHRRPFWPVVQYKDQVIAIPLVKRSGLYLVTHEESNVYWLSAAKL